MPSNMTQQLIEEVVGDYDQGLLVQSLKEGISCDLSQGLNSLLYSLLYATRFTTTRLGLVSRFSNMASRFSNVVSRFINALDLITV